MPVAVEEKLNINKYLNFIGACKYVGKAHLEPSLEILNDIVMMHVCSIPYQNYDIFRSKSPFSLSIKTLEKRLIDENRGGVCYETSELLCQALEQLGFDARRISGMLVNKAPYNNFWFPSHNFLVVHLNGKMYLVDVGLGFNSLRRPVEFSFQETEERTILKNEVYQLECNHDYYQLNLMVKNSKAPFYRFERPLRYINKQEAWKIYDNLMTYQGIIPAKDNYLLFGILRENGRIGFKCEFDEAKRELRCDSYEFHHNQPPKRCLLTYQNVTEKIKSFVNLDITNNKFKECTRKWDSMVEKRSIENSTRSTLRT